MTERSRIKLDEALRAIKLVNVLESAPFEQATAG